MEAELAQAHQMRAEAEAEVAAFEGEPRADFAYPSRDQKFAMRTGQGNHKAKSNRLRRSSKLQEAGTQ